MISIRGLTKRFGAQEILQIVDLLFFFQAEDGIRDDLVTGVQTCALPICADRRLGAAQGRVGPRLLSRPAPKAKCYTFNQRGTRGTAPAAAGARGNPAQIRSEERRVGKRV